MEQTQDLASTGGDFALGFCVAAVTGAVYAVADTFYGVLAYGFGTVGAAVLGGFTFARLAGVVAGQLAFAGVGFLVLTVLMMGMS